MQRLAHLGTLGLLTSLSWLLPGCADSRSQQSVGEPRARATREPPSSLDASEPAGDMTCYCCGVVDEQAVRKCGIPDEPSCRDDSDCVLVPTECCACAQTLGNVIAVPKYNEMRVEPACDAAVCEVCAPGLDELPRPVPYAACVEHHCAVQERPPVLQRACDAGTCADAGACSRADAAIDCTPR